MTLWISKYQLFPKLAVNSKVKRIYRMGALLRVRFPDGLIGYADLCPFPEMGDRPLELELRDLARGTPQGPGVRSLLFAKWDAEARAKKVSLYDPNVRIRNHFLILNIIGFQSERVKELEGAGFREFKVKIGKNLDAETDALEKFVAELSSSSRLRIDFNSSLARDKFTAWFERVQSWLRPKLEFLEDPFAYDASEWRKVSEKYGIRLALDLAADSVSTFAEGAEIVVIKPAVQDERQVIEKLRDKGKRFVFTHYLDFPLGQMAALVATQRVFPSVQEQVLSCGLQHHDIYEGFTFQDQIRHDGPFIIPPEGYGFGFDSLLESTRWEPLA